MGYRTALDSVRDHPLYATASELERYLGVGCDLVHLTILISIAGGAMPMPLPLDIYTNSFVADLMAAHRILELIRRRFRRVDTQSQLRELERKGFVGIAAILIRGSHRTLFRDATEVTAGAGSDVSGLPSVIRITDELPSAPPVSHTLQLMAAQVERDLEDFGYAFATYTQRPDGRTLADLLLKLPVKPAFHCDFRNRYKGSASSGRMLVFERVLVILAAIRVHHAASRDTTPVITIPDYRCARTVLTSLPLTPVGTSVSPRALEVAELIHQALADSNYQRSLPDHSAAGSKWFRRTEARQWSALSYSAVKSHLAELEEEGLLRSTVAETDRRQGREIHYRFDESCSPPFAWRNPFAAFPEINE
jgi:hypothetical protein